MFLWNGGTLLKCHALGEGSGMSMVCDDMQVVHGRGMWFFYFFKPNITLL